jgi:Fuc2NAc and GlcNAc transferase
MIVILGCYGEWHLMWLLGLLGASVAGFLVWNWPPAKVFMGDVGSGFIGYVLAVVIVMSVQHQPNLLWVWFIILGVFLIDATVTLVRRVLRGDPFYVAHRSHAFQHATDRLGSHRYVTLSIVGINACWLGPCAWFAYKHPSYVFVIQLIALLPLLVLAIQLGAGVSKKRI